MIRGWLVLRFVTEAVESGEAVQTITRALWSISQRRNQR